LSVGIAQTEGRRKQPGCGESTGLLQETQVGLMTENRAGALLVRALCCWCLLVTLAGCSRTRYRLAADRDAAAILQEKSACQPWQLPAMFSVYPDPRSRFFDPTPTDDPALPVPAPQLYAYALPELPERDPGRFGGQAVEGLAAGLFPYQPDAQARLPWFRPLAGESGLHEAVPPPGSELEMPWGLVQQAAYQASESAPPSAPPQDISSIDMEQLSLILGLSMEELRILRIPQATWQSLPVGCLRRMLEFASVRKEYRDSFGREPDDDLRDRSQRLALEDVMQLALINSREYQARKERLYSAALDLSLERFDYDLKFATSGNRAVVDYLDQPAAVGRQSALNIRPTVTGDQLLATGGTFLASFANRVLLTFNGPSGFSADVGSDLLFDFSQPIFQRDIVLESLTQAERDVVYAARDFARYRKTLFGQLAGQYYSLLLAYRGIEIDTQDYFSMLRGFDQGEAEYRAGRLPRFQVDQFEQSTLTSRRQLISSCNSLEQGFDRLKISIGLPTELPINLDLSELEQLTLRDELMAVAERVRRARRNLIQERTQPSPERGAVLNASVDLVRKMLLVERLRERLGQEASQIAVLQLELAQLAAAESRLDVQAKRDAIAREEATEAAPSPLQVFQRTMDLIDSLLVLISRQLRVAESTSPDAAAVSVIRQRKDDLSQRHKQLRADLEEVVVISNPDRVLQDLDRVRRGLERIPEFVRTAMALLADTEAVAQQLQGLLPPPPADAAAAMQQTLADADRLIAESEQSLARKSGGLTPVEIEVDDAMLTALTLRYDLMNQRESLADRWRDIKFQGDDLKSILNLQARQQLKTRSGYNRPFDFTFDEGTTQLRLEFDAPLNRRAQRNDFRKSLIDYNAGLRVLIETEDEIKFDVRDSLRNLSLDREQYEIAVASAALAYERRISTTLQLRLGLENIRVQDVLDAQDAYTGSLSQLARWHVQYILDRIGLFLDLELLEVDGQGFWTQLYDEELQPAPNLQLPDYALPVYGQLPRGTLPSHQIKRMLQVPPGQTMIFRPDGTAENQGEDVLAPPPDAAAAPQGGEAAGE